MPLVTKKPSSYEGQWGTLFLILRSNASMTVKSIDPIFPLINKEFDTPQAPSVGFFHPTIEWTQQGIGTITSQPFKGHSISGTDAGKISAAVKLNVRRKDQQFFSDELIGSFRANQRFAIRDTLKASGIHVDQFSFNRYSLPLASDIGFPATQSLPKNSSWVWLVGLGMVGLASAIQSRRSGV